MHPGNDFFSKETMLNAELNNGTDRMDLDSCFAGIFRNRLTNCHKVA